jgi:hypothetical protein
VLRLRANVLTMEHARAKRRRQADAALQLGPPTGAFDETVHTSELEGDASDMEDDGRAIAASREAREELGEETMDELNKLRSSTRRFDLQLKAISVHQMEQWYHTNLVMGTKLTVPEHYYQRNAASGWSHDQKAEYLRTVFAGQAGTPFVINKLRQDARVVDGGHRLNALLQFKKNEVGMKVGSKLVRWRELDSFDQEHFNDQNLVVQEYKNVIIKDEVDIYIMLNSGMPFSPGEKLAAMQHINDLVKVSAELVRHSPKLMQSICKEMALPTSGKDQGRKNELLAACFCAYNVHYRKNAAPGRGRVPMAVSMKEQFVQAVCDLKDNDRLCKLQKNKTAIEQAVLQLEALVARVLELYNSVANLDDGCSSRKRIHGQTPFRRMVMCLLAVSEIEDLDSESFRAFVEAEPKHESRARARVRRLLTHSKHLDADSIDRIVLAYQSFATSRRALPGPVLASVTAGPSGAGM